MRIRRFACALLWVMLITMAGTVPALADTAGWKQKGEEVCLVRRADNFLILYDRSGTMAQKHNGTIMTKMQAERKILLEKNATLPDMNWQAGIYSFTPAGELTNLVEYYPMQAYDKKKFSWTLIRMPIEPKGPTMLQPGLAALDGVLSGLRGRTVVFLFTDGQYSPAASMPAPGDIARRLAAKYDVCFGVISTGTESQEIATINSIASATPCSYSVGFDQLLGNPEWMTNALFDVAQDQSACEAVGWVFENILFDFDKDTIKPQYHQALNDAAAYLREHPEANIVLAGHTDSIGTRDYNMGLSHRRAAAVRSYLVKNAGVAKERITLSGFGFSQPVAPNSTSEGRAQNRRVQGIITGKK